MRSLLTLIPVAALLGGCAFVPGGDPGPGGGGGGGDDDGVIPDVDAGVVAPPPTDGPAPPPPPPPPLLLVCRVDKMQVGTVGLAVRVGDSAASPIVTFKSWRTERGAVVGFTLSDEATAMRYVVRADGQELSGQGTTFDLPRGAGRDATIERIEFCLE